MLSETELAEVEERATRALACIEDPEARTQYAKRAADTDVPLLLKALRDAYAANGGGGDLGLLLRDALKDRILAESPRLSAEDKRIAMLSDDVTIHSMAVSAMAGSQCVYVDFRLQVGEAPVLK